MKSEDTPLDFDKIIPYPKEFSDMDKIASDWEKNRTTESYANKPKDGFNSGGYEWCCENWGTKWNACIDEGVDWDVDGDYAIIHFNTAWAPPEPIIAKLREKFPDANFNGFYREDGMQICGYF